MSRKLNQKRTSVGNLDYAKLEDRKVLDAASCGVGAGLESGLQAECEVVICTYYVPESLPDPRDGGITNDLQPIYVPVDPNPGSPVVDGTLITDCFLPSTTMVDLHPDLPVVESTIVPPDSPDLLLTVDEYEQILGMTWEQAIAWAEEKQIEFRPNKIDGEDLFVTMDYIVGRINAHLEHGVVVGLEVEGTLIQVSMSDLRVGIPKIVVAPIETPHNVVDFAPELETSQLNPATGELNPLRFVGFADSNGKTLSSVMANSDSRQAPAPVASSQTLASSVSGSNFASTDLLFEGLAAETINPWRFLNRESDSPKKLNQSDLNSVFEKLEKSLKDFRETSLA